MVVPHRAALLLFLAAGCGDPAPDPTGPETARASEDIEPFRELGYAGWEEEPEGSSAEPPVGVTLHLADQASAGVNLYTDEQSTCFAVDMEGQVLHRWVVQGHDQVECFELLEDGSILALSVDQGVSYLDVDSNLIWRTELAAHHDLALLPDGGVLVPTHAEHDHAGRRVRFDSVVRLNARGLEVDRWNSREHLAELAELHGEHALDSPQTEDANGEADTVYDYYHLNAVERLDETTPGLAAAGFEGGQLLLCLRNVDLLLLLDPVSGAHPWSFGPGVLDRPHSPTLTPEGRILVFDNGWRRGRSRLVEIDPATNAITWTWEAEAPATFFSAVRGSCQRLENGHTLVTESERGRVFELDAAGTKVWEFWSPRVEDGRRRRIYRMVRVPWEGVRGWLRGR